MFDEVEQDYENVRDQDAFEGPAIEYRGAVEVIPSPEHALDSIMVMPDAVTEVQTVFVDLPSSSIACCLCDVRVGTVMQTAKHYATCHDHLLDHEDPSPPLVDQLKGVTVTLVVNGGAAAHKFVEVIAAWLRGTDYIPVMVESTALIQRLGGDVSDGSSPLEGNANGSGQRVERQSLRSWEWRLRGERGVYWKHQWMFVRHFKAGGPHSRWVRGTQLSCPTV
ncbi:hypothetical protein AAFF_G00364360 [Aldrovandia affinis]|uniref:Uncharacterized protein n=1 Tax=Aldrovandia affinis TaxID=143900 RepID=A0AAD7WNQ6_9TELE|nr:hypothetical protein AAFF_G00364360 [Aldrovandia affinis]